MWPIVAATGVAFAEPRFAIVIGSNRGEPDEAQLAFAERDAQRMAEVLTRLGGVPAENLLLLLSPNREALERALAVFRSRIANGVQGAGATVIVYYSGHADRRALHLAGTRLPFDDFKAGVRALGADLAVFFIDACRSGGIVRRKGATPTEPFDFAVEDALLSEGLAIITSSAENEDAQESERLEGGVFTHHLVAGLLGAADTSGDARVSLSETYRYAYAQTLAATSASSIVQHPTYDFEVRGQREIMITRLDAISGRARLALPGAGHYLVFERFGGHEIVAELEARAGTVLSLPGGRYLVRRREPSAAFERELLLRPDVVTTLHPEDMTQVPFRHAVRKGYGLVQRRVLSLGAAYEVAGEVLPGTGLVHSAALGLQLDFAEVALQLRARYGRSPRVDNGSVAMEHGLLGLDLGLYHLFDLGTQGLGFGLRGGFDWLAQRFATTGAAPPVDQIIGRVGPFARFEAPLGARATLTLDGGLDIYFLEVAKEHTDGFKRILVEERAVPVVPTVNLGLNFSLP